MSNTFLGMPSLPVFGHGNLNATEPFPQAARRELANTQPVAASSTGPVTPKKRMKSSRR